MPIIYLVVFVIYKHHKNYVFFLNLKEKVKGKILSSLSNTWKIQLRLHMPISGTHDLLTLQKYCYFNLKIK